MKGDLGKVYMGDDEPCNIIGMGNVIVSLSNDSMLKLENIRHVSRLKGNLISVNQLVDVGMKTTFDSDLYNIKKGAMITTHSKKKDTIYMTSGSTTLISVASSDVDASTLHRRFGHMSEKGMRLCSSKASCQG